MGPSSPTAQPLDTFGQRPRLHVFLLIRTRLREDIFSFQSLPSSKNSSDGSCMWWRSSLFAQPSFMSFPHTASIYMSPRFPSTSVAVLSQASVSSPSLHVGGSRAQSLSSLTILTVLVISSNLLLLNATYVPQPPHIYFFTSKSGCCVTV